MVGAKEGFCAEGYEAVSYEKKDDRRRGRGAISPRRAALCRTGSRSSIITAIISTSIITTVGSVNIITSILILLVY